MRRCPVTTTDPTADNPASDDLPPVQVALVRAASEVGAIPKSDVNAQQGFNYRGIERVLAGAKPALLRHGILAIPKVLEMREHTVERGKDRNLWRLVVLRVEYRFYGPRGDFIPAEVFSEGQDNGDKATSKAMTMAYKSCLLQALQIADADSDPDATTPPERSPADAPPPLSPNNAAAARKKATGAGLNEDQLAEVVMRATNDRTAVLEEVHATEVRALRDAMQAAERKEPDPAPPSLALFAELAPKVAEKVLAYEDHVKASGPQIKALVVTLKRVVGAEDDEDQRAALTALLGTPVRSRAALTAGQVRGVLDVLNEEAQG